MRVVLIGRDLIIGSRVAEAAARADAAFTRIGSPASLPSPSEVDLLLVDWADRHADWGRQIAEWRAGGSDSPSPRPRVLVFGPHTDLEAHAEARAAGIGPMVARSKLVSSLGGLLEVT